MNLGLQLNIEKSILTPVQNIQFIWAFLDSLTTGASLSMDRFQILLTLIKTVQESPQTSVKNCLQLLGYMAACSFARLHLCCFQECLRTVYSLNRHSLDKHVLDPQWLKHSLDW